MDTFNTKCQLTLAVQKSTSYFQDQLSLDQVPASFINLAGPPTLLDEELVEGADFSLRNGDIVIAGITNCAHMNPADMLEASLLAQKAAALGLTVKPWVQASIRLDTSKITNPLQVLELEKTFRALGFEWVKEKHAGTIASNVKDAIDRGNLMVASLLSCACCLDAQAHNPMKANYIGSPALVVAYAITGTVKKDLTSHSLAYGKHGQPVYLKDIWPTAQEIQAALKV